MKTLSLILMVLAISSGFCGQWIAMSNLAFGSFLAWTFESDEEENEHDAEEAA